MSGYLPGSKPLAAKAQYTHLMEVEGRIAANKAHSNLRQSFGSLAMPGTNHVPGKSAANFTP